MKTCGVAHGTFWNPDFGQFGWPQALAIAVLAIFLILLIREKN